MSNLKKEEMFPPPISPRRVPFTVLSDMFFSWCCHTLTLCILLFLCMNKPNGVHCILRGFKLNNSVFIFLYSFIYLCKLWQNLGSETCVLKKILNIQTNEKRKKRKEKEGNQIYGDSIRRCNFKKIVIRFSINRFHC